MDSFNFLFKNCFLLIADYSKIMVKTLKQLKEKGKKWIRSLEGSFFTLLHCASFLLSSSLFKWEYHLYNSQKCTAAHKLAHMFLGSYHDSVWHSQEIEKNLKYLCSSHTVVRASVNKLKLNSNVLLNELVCTVLCAVSMRA